VRFPSRVMLAGSVLGVFAVSSGVVLLMPGGTDDADVSLPEFAASSESEALAPAEPAVAVEPAISGAQIAELALAPARDRAATLIAERAEAEAAAEQAREDDDEDDDSSDRVRSDDWRELRDRIREACEDGRIKGQICRG
jgi:hypothetical protein